MCEKMDRAFAQAISCLVPERQAQMQGFARQNEAEEIRLRVGRPPAVRLAGAETPLALPPVSAEELRETLGRAAQYSVHSFAESLQNGFVTIEGGHRLGLCGTAASENGQVIGVRTLASVNLRVARQIPAAATQIAAFVQARPLASTLILSPPGFGKTTLIREWVRLVSDMGHTVAVADERGEIAALRGGAPQFAIGQSTDVLAYCSKKQAAVMLLKTMSPALLAMDEITAPADLQAAALCAHCGTAVLASVHARSPADLSRQPLHRALLALGVFEQAVVIEMQDGRRRYRLVEWEGDKC